MKAGTVIAALGVVLTASVTTASAEAWLLWNAYSTSPGDRMERAISAAFESKRECEIAMPMDMERSMKIWRRLYDTVSKDDTSTILAKGTKKDPNESMIIAFSCWPVGLRPRNTLGGAEYVR
jgi:hypothetical protein